MAIVVLLMVAEVGVGGGTVMEIGVMVLLLSLILLMVVVGMVVLNSRI